MSELEPLHGPHNVTHVGGRLEIIGCRTLDDLEGLANLDHAWGHIIIEDNFNINDASGRDGLRPDPATGYVCLSFRACNNCHGVGTCVGNHRLWDLSDDIGGESSIRGEVVIERN